MLDEERNENLEELEEVTETSEEEIEENESVDEEEEELDESDDEEYDEEDEDEEEEEEVEEEPLLTTFSDIDLAEYRKMEKRVPSSVLVPNLIRVLAVIAIIGVVAAFFIPLIYVLPVFIGVVVIAIAVVCLMRGMLADKAYKKMMRRDPSDTHRDYLFFEGYMRYKGKVTNARIQYYEIIQCIETDDNFYLRVKGRRAVIILQKKNCSEELIAFVKGKFGSLK